MVDCGPTGRRFNSTSSTSDILYCLLVFQLSSPVLYLIGVQFTKYIFFYGTGGGGVGVQTPNLSYCFERSFKTLI